jgi:AraC-like DNA-binding protein
MYKPLPIEAPPCAPSPLVADVVRYIEAHYAQCALPGGVLPRANCSPRHLARMFRREMGETIGRYLARVRVRRAAALIERGEKIEAASLLVGYRSSATLFRHFQRFLGTTPRQFVGHTADEPADRMGSPVARTKAFIDTHYGQRVTLNGLAAMAGSSRRQLTTRFEREVGQTVHAYLTEVRIRHGAALVLAGERIEDVSLLVGYRSKKNFYRAFRALIAMSPMEYRASVRHQATMASSNSAHNCSGPAARGDSVVTRCCGSVPSTSAGMSDDE